MSGRLIRLLGKVAEGGHSLAGAWGECVGSQSWEEGVSEAGAGPATEVQRAGAQLSRVT